ncbi:flavin-containing monooxygenase [Phormidium tenue]|uniref:FAD-dependent oxidoreductase n=1 Tax=Phormidium tenue FACHB-1050 TaxID=2692857 RepID=A0ABR8CEY4_9CYAN|nr:SidA/IucD/PvdA family monooxygenase [Phormidium tenue]MBD2318257.1 FAD-dependent oxidoreductase [Phormidium tenue FACHB-1050]
MSEKIMGKKIAVIGAGLSGLATIKELVEEGHDVVCFEKNNDIGGVFSDLGTNYDSLHLTASNYFMAYSDFMPYHEKIRFWTRQEYKEYLDQYSIHFDLLKNIKFNYLVEEVKLLDNGLSLTVKDITTGACETQYFDSLAVCSGQFQKPNIPEIIGLNKFPGKVLHSSEYKNPEQCKSLLGGKRVLCLGMGESAADIVTEIAEIAGNTTLSLRRYHLFAPKYIDKDKPIDVLQTRFWHSLPANKKSSLVRDSWRYFLTSQYEPDKLSAQHMLAAPDEPGSVVTKTERIFDAVAKGMEIDIGGIQEISGSTVLFNSGRKEEFDVIVFCTGFKFHLPFLNSELYFEDIRDCYLQVFHPSFRDKIAFIGFIRPTQGGIPLISELQARYYALVLSAKRSLPENLEILAQQDKAKWKNEFYETPNVFGLVNGVRYNDGIAELIGCRPPRPLFIKSPIKFCVYWFHHVWPCQYRLIGPSSRESAHEKWTLAPTSLFNSTDPLKLKLSAYKGSLKNLFLFWFKSQFAKDKKEQWRPIFKSKPRA